MNTICLVIDRLHGGYVGAYGNSWVETPAFDRLAAEGFVFDQFLINSPRLEALYRSLWWGRHPLVPGDAAEPTLAERLAQAGVSPVLLTDEPILADPRLARGFNSRLFVERPAQAEVANEVDETHLAQCFVQLIDWLSRPHSKPFFLWCHLAGLGGPWDAPLEFRRRYAAEDDPDPPQTAQVPNLLLEEDYDPDFVLGFSQTYAGQVALLDTCLAALLEHLETTPSGKDTLLVLLSARGMPLGEHRRVGPYDAALYNELVHVPLVVRFPDGLGAAERSQALVEPGDVWATLTDWWGLAGTPQIPSSHSLLPIIRGEKEQLRDRLCLVDDDAEEAFRVPAWYLRRTEKPELFVKPDDRWEVNDVADRCGDLVESLEGLLEECKRSLQMGQLTELPPLAEIFVTDPE